MYYNKDASHKRSHLNTINIPVRQHFQLHVINLLTSTIVYARNCIYGFLQY